MLVSASGALVVAIRESRERRSERRSERTGRDSTSELRPEAMMGVGAVTP